MLLDEELQLFNPPILKHWILYLSYVGFTIYMTWITLKQPLVIKKPSHKYSRKTGKVEKNN